MNTVPPIETTIAERELALIDRNGVEDPVIVRVGAPYKEPDGDWRCPYEIESRDKTWRRGMMGVDSMRALKMTLKVLNTELRSLTYQNGKVLRWLGDDGDLGFDQQ